MPAPHKTSDEKTNRATQAATAAARAVADETADASQQLAQASAEIAQSHAETVRQIMQSSLGMATQAAERSVDQYTQLFGFSSQEAVETAQQTARNIKAIAECNTALARGFQDLSREWASLAQDRLQRNLEGFIALLRCRSWPDLIAAQSSLARDNLELLVTNTRRLAELSIGVASEAAEKITAEAEETTKRLRRAA